MTDAPSSGLTTTGSKVVFTLLAILVVGLGVALAGTASSAASDRSAQARRIDGTERQVRQSPKADDASSQRPRLREQDERVKRFEDCVPEVEAQLNSHEVDRESLLESLSTQVSRVRSAVVYDSTSGDGE